MVATDLHATSLAVWDVPSPVVMAAAFTATVGAKCAPEGCSLAGRTVKVYAEEGKRVGVAALGEAPLAGTQALYWAAIELRAPDREGVHTWRMSLVPGDDLHAASSYHFTFATTRPPQCGVTVTVSAADSKAPIAGATVLMGRYVAHTDDHGVATLQVPWGTFELTVACDGYQAAQMFVEANADRTVCVELDVGPTYAMADLAVPSPEPEADVAESGAPGVVAEETDSGRGAVS